MENNINNPNLKIQVCPLVIDHSLIISTGFIPNFFKKAPVFIFDDFDNFGMKPLHLMLLYMIHLL